MQAIDPEALVWALRRPDPQSTPSPGLNVKQGPSLGAHTL